MDKRNLTLVMDFYELTMSNGYYHYNETDQWAVFDCFYRSNPDKGGYAIFAGLHEVIEYVKNLSFSEEDIAYLRSLNMFDEEFLSYLRTFKFHGNIYSFKEGSIVYPYEPLITVFAPIIECQILETALLLYVNHETLIATKTNRIVLASKGRGVSDFGARRAHNMDAAIYGAKAAYIGGANSTATVYAAKEFNIPVSGTMAHSWVMTFEDEYEAFKKYAELYSDNCVLLIDTYDVLHSGIINAIKVAKEVLIPMGKRLKGVRIDSGDLAYLSKKIRQILDKNDMKDCKVVASNSLDEYTISSLLDQGAKIDSFGVGEKLITSASSPVLGAVYKLAAIKKDDVLTPKIKISASVGKITNPGFKTVYRVYDEQNKSIADLIALKDEVLDFSKPLHFVDPLKPWKNRVFENCTFKNMHETIFENGELVYKEPSLDETRQYVRMQVDNLMWEAEKRFEFPHIHYLDYTYKFNELKLKMIEKYSQYD